MRFDISEKLSSLIFVLLLAVLLPWMGNLALFLVILILQHGIQTLRPISQTSSARFKKTLGFIALTVAVMIPVNGLLIDGGEAFRLAGGLTLHSQGLRFGLQTGARLLVLTCALLTLFASTPIPVLAHYFHEIGLPSSMVLTLLLTLCILDQLPNRISAIFVAQEARGAPVRAHALARIRSFFKILSPLVLSSMVESIDRGMALELRGFQGDVRLSFGGQSDQVRRMSALSVVFLVLSCLSILGIIYQWVRQ